MARSRKPRTLQFVWTVGVAVVVTGVMSFMFVALGSVYFDRESNTRRIQKQERSSFQKFMRDNEGFFWEGK